MRKKLIYYLSALFLLFALGVGLSITNTYLISRDIESVISLHRVEIVRQNLVINAQTVQGNLYTTGTVFGKQLDVIVENVLALEESSNNCLNCHHNPEVTDRLKRIVRTVDQYKQAISQLITSSANEKRIERLKMVAIGIGDSLLSKTQDMAFLADKSLNAKTMGALNKIKNSVFILFGTVILAFLIAVMIAFKLTEMITRPINELLNATRMITEGNLGYSITYSDHTEFGELARNFNTMSTALKEGYDNIYRQQQQIRESEWKFRILSEFTSDWEYWMDEKGEIVFMPASSCERISGYTREEFMANPGLLFDIVHPDDKDIRRNLSAADESGGQEEVELRIIAKSGETRWLSHIRRPIYVDDKFLGQRVSNRDITDRKMLEEQLVQSRKMESLGLMAGGVAHDFNNLLTVITGYGSILEQQLAGADEKTVRSVKQMLAASEKAQDLTASLLAFSRKKILRPSTIKLGDVIRNNLGLLKSLIKEDIELALNCSETEFPIFADTHQMEQVLMNLVTNGRDAMPEGGSLSIATAPVIVDHDFAGRYGARPGKYMMLSVTDSGSGIDGRDIPHIFEPFFTTKGKAKGTGLGLSMVYGIIKQHQGFIDVQSRKGEGTTFRIYQPASAGMEGAERERAVREDRMVCSGDETILIAEDEPAVREFLRDILESYGYTIMLAADGLEAVDKFNSNRDSVDMIVLDVIMPRMNGKEAYDRIKEAAPGIKTLFMSGYTHDILTSRGVFEEGLEFISKPLDASRMLLKIRKILNG